MQFKDLPGLEEVTRGESLIRNLGDLTGTINKKKTMENSSWEFITNFWFSKESEEPIVVRK